MKKYRDYTKTELIGYYGKFFAVKDYKGSDNALICKCSESQIPSFENHIWIDNGDICGVEMKFTKSDLRNGHRLTDRKGRVYIYLVDVDTCYKHSNREIIVCTKKDSNLWHSANNYDENFEYMPYCNQEYDIMKVEKVSHPYGIFYPHDELHTQVLFERKS